jgi:prophage regulatory protein
MTDQILRFEAVSERTGLKRTAIYERIKTGEFPAPVALGKRARDWRLSEIEMWIKARGRAEKWQPRRKRAA